MATSGFEAVYPDYGAMSERRQSGIWLILAITWLTAVAVWTLDFSRLMAEVVPILDMFETQAGRELSGREWYDLEQAQAIVAPGGAIGSRTAAVVDARQVYLPVLGIYAVAIYGSGIVLAVTSRAFDRTRKMLAVAIVVLIVVQLAVFWSNADAISALSNINE